MNSSYYVQPEHVTSPKTYWHLDCVLYNGGFGEWSVAEGQWGTSGKRENVLAIRWNGGDGRPPIGTPQSRGLPVWFIVPGELKEAIREVITELKKRKQTD